MNSYEMLFHCGFVQSFFITYKAEHFFRFFEGGLFGILCIVSLYPDFFFKWCCVSLSYSFIRSPLYFLGDNLFQCYALWKYFSSLLFYIFLLYCYLLMPRSFTTVVVFLLVFFFFPLLKVWDFGVHSLRDCYLVHVMSELAHLGK